MLERVWGTPGAALKVLDDSRSTPLSPAWWHVRVLGFRAYKVYRVVVSSLRCSGIGVLGVGESVASYLRSCSGS